MNLDFCAVRNEHGYPCLEIVSIYRKCEKHEKQDDIDTALEEWRLSIAKGMVR